VEFDPWQVDATRLILAKGADGVFATSVGGVVLSIPRQVGKTFMVGAVVFALCLLYPGLTVIWTAHRARTAGETFTAMQAFARRHKVKPHVSKIVLGSGEEAVEFANGSRVLFGARERGFGLGFAKVGVLVMDEAQRLTDTAIDDMVPTTNQAEAPFPLLLFMGTPPRPNDPGEVFQRKRMECLAGESDDTVYIEFSADQDADPLDREQWAKANPSFPLRTPARSMLRMKKNLTDDSFMREALGIWNPENANRVIDAQAWARVADPASMAVERLALGVDVSPDRGKASVALAGERFDGLWHVELDEQGDGTDWVVPLVANLCEKNTIRAVVVDALSPAAALLEEFARAKVKVTVTSSGDLANACGQFYDAVMGRVDDDGVSAARLRHRDQPQLNAALGSAGKRPLGDRWAWNRRVASADITPVVAATLALWGSQAKTVKRPGAGSGRRQSAGRKAVVL